MGEVIQLNRKRVFNLKEARDLLPIVLKITDESNSKVKALIMRLEAVRAKDPELAKQIEVEINGIVEQWQTKVEKLGADSKGVWLVDFDCGTGYLCWKYPEDKLEHFHSYTDGFQGRKKLEHDHVPGPHLDHFHHTHQDTENPL